jgi:diguanylate cyclase (GGDEF)-like protein
MVRSLQLCAPGEAVGLLVLDLDVFKKVNDQHGHAAGDRLLVMFAEVLRGSVRSSDVVARIGGDEFGVLLPRASAEAALETAERIRTAFRLTAAELNMDGIAGTVSIGAAIGAMPMRGAIDGVGPLLARADIALYRAKASGRDRTEIFLPATATDA